MYMVLRKRLISICTRLFRLFRRRDMYIINMMKHQLFVHSIYYVIFFNVINITLFLNTQSNVYPIFKSENWNIDVDMNSIHSVSQCMNESVLVFVEANEHIKNMELYVYSQRQYQHIFNHYKWVKITLKINHQL